jgi:hypothetical protein
MSEEEQFKLEKELAAARDRQEAQETQEGQADQTGKKGQKGQAGAAKKSAPATDKKAAPLAKKQPTNAILVPPAGVKTSP